LNGIITSQEQAVVPYGRSAKRLSRRFVGIEKDDKYFYTAYKNIYE